MLSEFDHMRNLDTRLTNAGRNSAAEHCGAVSIQHALVVPATQAVQQWQLANV